MCVPMPPIPAPPPQLLPFDSSLPLSPPSPQGAAVPKLPERSSPLPPPSAMGCTVSHSDTTTFVTSSAQTPPCPPPPATQRTTSVVNHPPLRRGDSHHLVSLTSTTYGSLLLLDQLQPPPSPAPPATPPEKEEEEHLTPTAVINAWELMDGLDDPVSTSPTTAKTNPVDATAVCRSTSIDYRRPPAKENPKPLWKHLSEESLLADMDPSVASTLRRSFSSSVAARRPSPPPPPKLMPTSPKKVVLYTTSLRGIRRTYEDCCVARSILRAQRVAVDERDVSMDASYRKELQGLLGKMPLSLPQVFVGGARVGGADEVRQLNETGELRRFLEGAAVMEDPGFVCPACGGVRFSPCGGCSGSRKVFVEEEGQVRRCSLCNENGLVRCLACC